MKFEIQLPSLIPSNVPVGNNLRILQSTEIDDKTIHVHRLDLDRIMIHISISYIKESVLRQNHNLQNLQGYTVIGMNDFNNIDFSTIDLEKKEEFTKIIKFSYYSSGGIPEIQQYYVVFIFNDKEDVKQELYYFSIPLKALYLDSLFRSGKIKTKKEFVYSFPPYNK